MIRPAARRRFLLAALAVGAAGAVPALAEASIAPPDATTTGLEGDLTVFAAASLTDAFEAIGLAFRDANPDVELTFSFASSSDLVGQIIEGAPADVFASADVANMDKLVEAEANGDDPVTFATNSLAIIVEPGNPQGITGLQHLADNADLIVVSCAPEVPIGAYTQQVLANAGVEVEIDSFEENVRAVSAKVQLGEADAGIVYATDVAAAGASAAGVHIPADVNITADYPIATTADTTDPELAAAFVDFVLGDEGRAVLAGLGFGAPEPETSESTAPATSGA